MFKTDFISGNTTLYLLGTVFTEYYCLRKFRVVDFNIGNMAIGEEA